jgi:hypothetical protein
LAFKCKKCNLGFEEKKRLEIHKMVHDRKSKVSEYGIPGFNNDTLRGIEFYSLLYKIIYISKARGVGLEALLIKRGFFLSYQFYSLIIFFVL